MMKKSKAAVNAAALSAERHQSDGTGYVHSFLIANSAVAIWNSLPAAVVFCPDVGCEQSEHAIVSRLGIWQRYSADISAQLETVNHWNYFS